MGLLSFTDEELAENVRAEAQAVWVAGVPVFAHVLRAGVGTKNNFGTLLTLAIALTVEVGWRLHSVVPYINSVGPNNLEALLVFERP